MCGEIPILLSILKLPGGDGKNHNGEEENDLNVKWERQHVRDDRHYPHFSKLTGTAKAERAIMKKQH